MENKQCRAALSCRCGSTRCRTSGSLAAPWRRFSSPVTLSFRGHQAGSIILHPYELPCVVCLPKSHDVEPASHYILCSVWPTVSKAFLYQILTTRATKLPAPRSATEHPHPTIHPETSSRWSCRCQILTTRLLLKDLGWNWWHRPITPAALEMETGELQVQSPLGNLVRFCDTLQQECPGLELQSMFIHRELLGWLGCCVYAVVLSRMLLISDNAIVASGSADPLRVPISNKPRCTRLPKDNSLK